MSLSRTERHQIENEMIFRRSNENVSNGLDDLDAKYVKEGDFDLIRKGDIELYFKCECSDENCSARIPMSLAEYKKIHANRKAFIVKPDHQVDPIEKVQKATEFYYVVKKNNAVPEPHGGLNSTPINNS